MDAIVITSSPGERMPKKLTMLEIAKLYSGSTGAHIGWERRKKAAAKIVDTSVFKDGLGPALDSFGKAAAALDVAERKEAEARGPLTRREDRVAVPPVPPAVAAARKKATEAVLAKGAKLNGILTEYIRVCRAKGLAPQDKLTKPAGPTAAAKQTQVWTELAGHLSKLQEVVADTPAIVRANDRFVERPR